MAVKMVLLTLRLICQVTEHRTDIPQVNIDGICTTAKVSKQSLTAAVASAESMN